MEERPNLIVSMHDFEAVDPFVMQDIWEICRSVVHSYFIPSHIPLKPISDRRNVAFTPLSCL
jgi:hypothetical protein